MESGRLHMADDNCVIY